jgi:hypothetical protein
MGRRLAARVLLAGSLVAAPAGAASAQAPERPPPRPGIAPETPWACPPSHPIKGYLTDESGRVYHRPGTRYYEETSPDRCYATEEEARRDGSRRAPDG